MDKEPCHGEKANKKWRMSINFLDLTKHCPEDNCPLLTIDKLVDGFAWHKRLSCIDAFFRYNQMKMAWKKKKKDDKIALITEEGTYY